MKRRLFNLAAATSLLLCLPCLFMWGRSARFVDQACSEDGVGSLVSLGGGLRVLSVKGPPADDLPSPRHTWSSQPLSLGWHHDWTLKLPHYRLISVRGLPVSDLFVPYWLPTLVSAILPTIWFWRRRKEKRLNRRGFEVLPAPVAKTAP